MLSGNKFNNLLTSIIVILFLLITFNVYAVEDEEFAIVNVTDGDRVSIRGGGVTKWMTLVTDTAYGGVEKASNYENHEIEFKYTGTTFRWLGSKGMARGKADIYHNDELLVSDLDLYNDTSIPQAIIFEKDFEKGDHTITIKPTGEKSAEARSAHIAVDAFQYFPTIEESIQKAKKLLYESPLPPEVGDKLVAYYPQKSHKDLITALAAGIFTDKKEPYITDEEYRAGIAALNKAINKFENSVIEPTLIDLADDYDGTIFKGVPVWTEGKLNNGIYLDGNSYFALPRGLLEGETELTIEAWIKPEVDSGGARIIANDDDNVYHLRQNPRFRIADSGGSWQKLKSSGVEVGVWQHVAGVYDGEDMIIYLDGEEIARKNVGQITTNAPNEISAIGANVKKGTPGGSEFQGHMDEIRVWDIARTQEEIQASMEQELSGKEEGLVAYFNFNEF